MVSWKKVGIAFFYNTIKGLVKQVIGGIGAIATVPDDLIMALIGYLVATRTQYKEEGEALLLASVASLGGTMGAQILGAFGVTTAPTTPTAPTPTRAPTPVPTPAPIPRFAIQPIPRRAVIR
jgi:membrane protein DedA with SNARE-associated domain